MRPLRTAFVLHALDVAGAEVLVTEMVRQLETRIVPTIFCLDAIGRMGQALIERGVPVVALGRRPGWDWRVAWRLARELRTRRIDVIHAHQYTPFFYAALARALAVTNARLIFTEHGRHYPDLVSPSRRLANHLVFDRLADAVTAVCGFSARSLAEQDGFAPERIEVIGNGIDAERYGRAGDRACVLRQLGLDPSRRYVGTIARLHPVKDHETLLRAFPAVAAVVSDVDLLVVGDGPLREHLEQLTSTLGLDGRVRFLGVRSDVPAILSGLDVFALSSLSEASSITLLEAMASGVPVVATDVGGNPEIIRHGVEGLLVGRGDVTALGDAIIRVLSEPVVAGAMGAAGRARARATFCLDETVERYYGLYARVAR